MIVMDGGIGLPWFPANLMSEEMAQINHSQSLGRLNERGGMSPTEIMANLFRRDTEWTETNIKNHLKHIEILCLIVDAI